MLKAHVQTYTLSLQCMFHALFQSDGVTELHCHKRVLTRSVTLSLPYPPATHVYFPASLSQKETMSTRTG